MEPGGIRARKKANNLEVDGMRHDLDSEGLPRSSKSR